MNIYSYCSCLLSSPLYENIPTFQGFRPVLGRKLHLRPFPAIQRFLRKWYKTCATSSCIVVCLYVCLLWYMKCSTNYFQKLPLRNDLYQFITSVNFPKPTNTKLEQSREMLWSFKTSWIYLCQCFSKALETYSTLRLIKHVHQTN